MPEIRTTQCPHRETVLSDPNVDRTDASKLREGDCPPQSDRKFVTVATVPTKVSSVNNDHSHEVISQNKFFNEDVAS